MDSTPSCLLESDGSPVLEPKKISDNTLMALIKFLLKKRPNIAGKADAKSTEEVVLDAVGQTFVFNESTRLKSYLWFRFHQHDLMMKLLMLNLRKWLKLLWWELPYSGMVSSVRESMPDDRRFSIFTGTKRLHLRAATRDDQIAWIRLVALLSTEKRLRLWEEGVSEATNCCMRSRYESHHIIRLKIGSHMDYWGSVVLVYKNICSVLSNRGMNQKKELFIRNDHDIWRVKILFNCPMTSACNSEFIELHRDVSLLNWSGTPAEDCWDWTVESKSEFSVKTIKRLIQNNVGADNTSLPIVT